MTRPMSPGVRSSSSSASATDRFTTRQSSSHRCGPPTPVSTKAAPPGNSTTKPCTGQVWPSTPRRCAKVSRLISRATCGQSLLPLDDLTPLAANVTYTCTARLRGWSADDDPDHPTFSPHRGPPVSLCRRGRRDTWRQRRISCSRHGTDVTAVCRAWRLLLVRTGCGQLHRLKRFVRPQHEGLLGAVGRRQRTSELHVRRLLGRHDVVGDQRTAGHAKYPNDAGVDH